MNGTIRMPMVVLLTLLSGAAGGGVAWGALSVSVPDNAVDRLARVEQDINHIKTDVSDIKRLLQRSRYGGSSGWAPQ